MPLFKTDHLTPKSIQKKESLTVPSNFCDRTRNKAVTYSCVAVPILKDHGYKPRRGNEMAPTSPITTLYPGAVEDQNLFLA